MDVHFRKTAGGGGAIAAKTEITLLLSASSSVTVKLLDIFEQHVTFASHVSSDQSEGRPNQEVFCAST